MVRCTFNARWRPRLALGAPLTRSPSAWTGTAQRSAAKSAQDGLNPRSLSLALDWTGRSTYIGGNHRSSWVPTCPGASLCPPSPSLPLLVGLCSQPLQFTMTITTLPSAGISCARYGFSPTHFLFVFIGRHITHVCYISVADGPDTELHTHGFSHLQVS